MSTHHFPIYISFKAQNRQIREESVISFVVDGTEKWRHLEGRSGPCHESSGTWAGVIETAVRFRHRIILVYSIKHFYINEPRRNGNQESIGDHWKVRGEVEEIEPCSNILGPFSYRSSKDLDVLVSIESYFNDVVEPGKEWCQRECSNENGNKSVLDHWKGYESTYWACAAHACMYLPSSMYSKNRPWADIGIWARSFSHLVLGLSFSFFSFTNILISLIAYLNTWKHHYNMEY